MKKTTLNSVFVHKKFSKGIEACGKKDRSIIMEYSISRVWAIIESKICERNFFVLLEFIVNVQSHFNEIILYSFHGEIDKAIHHANYQWLLFYPCVYFFTMWDAFKDAGGGRSQFSFYPFVFSAYFVTIGAITAPKLRTFGILLGPVWLGMLAVIPGVIVGLFIKRITIYFTRAAE